MDFHDTTPDGDSPGEELPEPARPNAAAFQPTMAGGDIPVTARGQAAAPANPAANPEIPSTVMPGALQPDTGAVQPMAIGEGAGGDGEEAREPVAGAHLTTGTVLLRVLMALVGLLMLGLFFVPWDGQTLFWNTSIRGLDFLFRLFLAVNGAVFLLGALIPIPHTLRAVVAFVFGLTPLGLQKAMELRGASEVDLELIFGLALPVTLLLMVAALLHRRRVRSTILGRILVLLGFLGVAGFLLAPRSDQIPESMPLITVFEGLGNISDVAGAVGLITPLLLLLFALLSLLAFLPRRSSGLTAVWALGLLLYFALTRLTAPVLALVNSGDFWKEAPTLMSGFYLVLGLLLASHGLSLFFTRISGGDKPLPQ